jgi:putative hydrolase of the HAD superfamily
VLLTNGWDRGSRRRAADEFALDFDDMDERHHLTFDTYEEGRLSLDEYLDRVVFHRTRHFERQRFKAFMFEQSSSHDRMIELVRSVKADRDLRTAAVSNEGRELTLHRIRTFRLASFIDCFVCSCFVQHRKPDKEIYRIALEMVQAAPEQAAYIDDRLLFVEVARSLGIHAIHHTGYEHTLAALSALDLAPAEAAPGSVELTSP